MHGTMLKTSRVAKKNSILGIGNIKTIYRPRQKIVFKIYIMSLWVIWATFVGYRCGQAGGLTVQFNGAQK